MILSLLDTLDDHDDSAHLEKLYSGVAAAAYTGEYYSYRYQEESSADIRQAVPIRLVAFPGTLHASRSSYLHSRLFPLSDHSS